MSNRTTNAKAAKAAEAKAAKAAEAAKAPEATETNDTAPLEAPAAESAPEATSDDTNPDLAALNHDPEDAGDLVNEPVGDPSISEMSGGPNGELASNAARADGDAAVTAPDPEPDKPVDDDATDDAAVDGIELTDNDDHAAEEAAPEAPATKEPKTALLDAPEPRKAPEDDDRQEGGAVTLPEAAVTRMAAHNVEAIEIVGDDGEPVSADEAFTEADGSAEVTCLVRLVEKTVSQPFSRPVEVLLCAAGTRIPVGVADQIKARLA